MKKLTDYMTVLDDGNLEFRFDNLEAKGVIKLSLWSGISIEVDGRSAGAIDLYHPAHNDGPAQIIIDDGCGIDNNLAFVLLFPKSTELCFEYGVEELRRDLDGRIWYGYQQSIIGDDK